MDSGGLTSHLLVENPFLLTLDKTQGQNHILYLLFACILPGTWWMQRKDASRKVNVVGGMEMTQGVYKALLSSTQPPLRLGCT